MNNLNTHTLGSLYEAFTPARARALAQRKERSRLPPPPKSHIFEHAGIRFGIAICAEAGFDAPFNEAAAGGARLVLFPAAPGLYGRRTGETSWRAGLTWWEG